MTLFNIGDKVHYRYAEQPTTGTVIGFHAVVQFPDGTKHTFDEGDLELTMTRVLNNFIESYKRNPIPEAKKSYLSLIDSLARSAEEREELYEEINSL